MATAEQYAQWIVSNQDKQGTPEFETVAKAYKIARGGQVSQAEPEQSPLTAEESIVPTDEALAANQAPVPEDKGFFEQAGDVVEGVYEAGKTVATGATTGALGYAAGALKGIAEKLISGEFGTREAAEYAEREANRLAQEYTYAPRTETGQEIVKTIGEVAAPLEAVAPQLAVARVAPKLSKIKSVSKAADIKPGVIDDKIRLFIEKVRPGSQVIDPETSLPTRQFSKALEKRGLDFGSIVEDPERYPVLNSNLSPDEMASSILKRKLIDKDSDKALHKYRIGKGGKVESDDLGIEAAKQGIREGDISSMKSANNPTKIKMIKMLNKKRAIAADESKGLRFRPSDEIGNEAMIRFDFIKGNAKNLRRELDELANKTIDPRAIENGESKTGLRGLNINKEPIQDVYLKALDDLGVEVDQSGVTPTLGFKNSLISEDKTSQRIISGLTRILSKGDRVDARDAHLIKRQIDTLIDFNKKLPSGLTDAGKKVVEQVRKSINKAIREVSPEYARINDELSASIRAMDDFDKALGPSIDLDKPGAAKAVGQSFRGLLSNNKTRIKLDNAISNLERQARELGGDFKTELDKLVIFNQTLDDSFGQVARTGFSGGIESALAGGVKGIAIRKVAEKLDKAFSVSDKQRFDVLQKILKRDLKQ